MTREMQGISCTNRQRNHLVEVQEEEQEIRKEGLRGGGSHQKEVK